MENENPYEPPSLTKIEQVRTKPPLTYTEVFVIGVIVSLLFLMLAPSIPHPTQPTGFESLLIALTQNLFTICLAILIFSTTLTGLYAALLWTLKLAQSR